MFNNTIAEYYVKGEIPKLLDVAPIAIDNMERVMTKGEAME
jgi:hypothetical protein